MNWFHLLLAAISASVLASFTDWYFFGILFHDKYHSIPGVWKQYKNKQDEVRSITISTLYHSITCFMFVFACGYLQITALWSTIATAAIAWLMLPLPLLLSYGVYIRMDRHIVLSHSLGWLVRLIVTALCVSWLL